MRSGPLLLSIPAALLGQPYTAAVRGIVTDSSRSAVASAKVTLTEVDRNARHETLTDSAGL